MTLTLSPVLVVLLTFGFCAQAAASKEPDAARAMLKFFTAPPAAAVLRANGVEPFVE